MTGHFTLRLYPRRLVPEGQWSNSKLFNTISGQVSWAIRIMVAGYPEPLTMLHQ